MENQSKLDQWLLVSTAGLIVLGLMAVYSATNGTGDHSLFYRQLSWCVIGILAMVLIYFNDARVLRDNAYIFFAVGILLLVAVLIFGKKIGGHTSWMKIGILSFQPSEIVKMTIILALARFLSDDETDNRSITNLFIALAIAFIPVVLIMLQPDMGTILTMLPFMATMLIMAGFDVYILMLMVFPLLLMISGFFNIYLIIGTALLLMAILIFQQKKFKLHQLLVIGSGLAAGLFMHRFANEILEPHQIKRIQTFIDPMSDPQGARTRY